jgi:hypothetical protein
MHPAEAASAFVRPLQTVKARFASHRIRSRRQFAPNHLTTQGLMIAELPPREIAKMPLVCLCLSCSTRVEDIPSWRDDRPDFLLGLKNIAFRIFRRQRLAVHIDGCNFTVEMRDVTSPHYQSKHVPERIVSIKMLRQRFVEMYALKRVDLVDLTCLVPEVERCIAGIA